MEKDPDNRIGIDGIRVGDDVIVTSFFDDVIIVIT